MTITKIKNYWITFWGFFFFLGVLVNFFEIISRTFFYYSVDLMYDIPVWFTVWSVMMVAGPILTDGEHVSVDILRSKLYGTPRKIAEMINALACIIFGIIITWGGFIYVKQTMDFNMNFIRVISIPRWVVEICVPLGMFLFTIYAIIMFINVYRTTYTKENLQDNEYLN